MYELQKHRIQIEDIQETHIPHDMETTRGSYLITTSAAIKTENNKQPLGMYQGGVAIIIHNDLKHSIHRIERIGHRILKVTLKDGKGRIRP